MTVRSWSHHADLGELVSPIVLPVIDRFDHSLHVLTPDGNVASIICNGFDGPLSATVSAGAFKTVRSVKSIQFVTTPAQKGIRDASVACINLEQSRRWKPETQWTIPSTKILCGGVNAVRPYCEATAFFSTGSVGEALNRLRWHVIGKFDRYDVSDIRTYLAMMAGLGPGLTPAGSDWLVGLMCALNRIERSTSTAWCASRLRAALLSSQVLQATTRLCRTLLAYACEGVTAQPLLDLIESVAVGVMDIHGPARRVQQIGHTSGSDMMLGVLDAIDLGLRGRSDP